MRIAATLFTLLLAASAGAAPVPKELKKDHPDRCLGEWESVRAEFSGRAFNKDHLIFTRDTLNWKSSRDGPDSLWKITFDPAKDPKEFDIEVPAKPGKGGGNSKHFGIWKWDGDLLILCCRQDSRPTEFTSAEGAYLNVLRRHEVKR